MEVFPEEAIDHALQRAAKGRWSVGPLFDERVRRLVRNDYDRAEDRARRNERSGSQADQPVCKGDAFCSENFRAVQASSESRRFWIGANSVRFTRLQSSD